MISQTRSAVKVSDQAQRDHRDIIETVAWSAGLDKVFEQNLNSDADLRYSTGVYLYSCFLFRSVLQDLVGS